MFRRLIDSSDSDEEDKRITRSMKKTAKHKVSETVSKNPQHSETVIVENPSTPPRQQQQHSETAAAASPPRQQQQQHSKTATPISPSSPQSDSETAVAANSPVQAPIIPVHHLHVGYNALGEMVDQLTNEGEYVNMNNIDNIDNDFFLDVINELEQDDDLQQILNNVEVQPLEDPIDMDEGIDLGIAGEDDEFNYLHDF